MTHPETDTPAPEVDASSTELDTIRRLFQQHTPDTPAN